MELKEMFEADLKKKTDEASSKVAIVLKRAEEQGQMIESLHSSVAMYKRLYEEEQKRYASNSRSSDLPSVPGRSNFLHLLEDSQEATKRAQEKTFERIRSLEEDLAKARSEIIVIRSERDKLAMEANFVREKLEGIMKESERKREEVNGVLARNIEFSQLIIDHQRKLRESSESLHAAEEISRKLSMEVSILKQEKDVLSNAEKRASDEVSALSQRVYRLQATLDTIQSAEEVREEARAAERRKQEEHIKQLEREWAEAKKELQEERSNSRNSTSDRNQTLNNAVMQVEQMGKELAHALKAVSAAESRASVAEARLSDLEKKIRSSDPKGLDMDSGVVSLSDNEAEKRQESLEAELVSLRERVSELENDCLQKSEQIANAAAGKEDALVILQSETIQELTKTSQALASLQEEASELRKLADSRGSEISEHNSKWSEEKCMLEQQKNQAEKMYNELNEQISVDVLVTNIPLLLIPLCIRTNYSIADLRLCIFAQLGKIAVLETYHLEAQNQINLEILAETEISLMRQEKLRLQSQLESALKMAESARGSLNAERASTRASLLTEDEIKSLQLQRLRKVAQKAKTDSENLENLLKQKQTELDLCVREIERLRKESDLEKKRVDELRETYKNIDVADYNRLKDEVRKFEEKLKAKDDHLEELSGKEKNLDAAQQAQATMESETEKLKAEIARIKRSYTFMKKKLDKEKEDLNSDNQSLSKQLEEAKEAGKRTTTDATVEQVAKERDEKEQKIQILDKYLKKKDEELTKEKTERKSVEKVFKDALAKIKKEKTKVDEELVKLERYQTALANLSEEMDKLKQADGNLPEGTSAVQVLSGSVLNDQAAAYLSAVDSFERMARTIVLNSQGSTKSTDMVTEASPATVEPSGIGRSSSSKAPVATTQQQPKVKRLTLQKPNAELRRGRIIRPQLGKLEEPPQVDAEMPEAEGAGGEGKQSSSHVTESQGTTIVPPVETQVRKRQAESLASEPQQGTQGETSSEIAPPASKKPKGSESQPDTAEGQEPLQRARDG
ncbi:unnamed protein product [Eruca vesicaria subsp. sativa]|uniref:Nucleoprotein TPR/MLP1-2 domain-containing protein n=1 Tax=Eruca vesicaria subsp. sativa TaxID=29727 RepID=A0ABC8K739_ERUVS|nr:unnamed protein product [Eruca vesicaria subsp. sativa]